MLIDPPRTDRHDVRLRLVKQLAVVGKTTRCLETLECLRSAAFIRIRNTHDFAFRKL
jgi:hypothetical protein